MIRVTVDLVIFTIQDHRLKVLLIKRKIPPFQGEWALPGGFVLEGESLDDAAKRELAEEAGVRHIYLEQLYSFGDPKRDPRAQVVTIAYYALIASDKITLRAATDASDARWFDMSHLPKLAFDHRKILDYALFRLRNKLEYTTVGFQLLPATFTLTDLQRMYESILGKTLDKRNFRRKLSLLNILKPLNERRRQGVARPARLYRFKDK